MRKSGRRECSCCHHEITGSATWCVNCGRNIPQTRIRSSKARGASRSYELVPDGSDFAITYRGEVKIGGLKIETAKVLVAALNSRRLNKRR